MRIVKIVIWIWAGLILGPAVDAQTCCSGGVPVASNLGLPPSQEKNLQISVSYDLNVLNTLKTGTEIIDDNSRDRKTHSVLLELGYGFSDRFSVDMFLSWVRQERTIEQFGNTNFTFTQGLGDAVFLFKYKFFGSLDGSTQFTGGLGVKPPFGSSDLRDRRGLTLSADLQPGSGAWDGILWAQYTRPLNILRPSASFSLTGSYSVKGSNTDYLGSQTYQFGKELLISTAFSDRLLLGNAVFDPSLTFRYRQVEPDENDGQDVPSTGGQWVFIRPALSYWFTADMAFNAGITLPLFADITGTQVTPTYRINLGLYYNINFNKQETFINPLE
ncbi:MAG: transporter [Saprospiraceae bacterium]|nr:transporter [Saprospiraceae bacterium]